MNLRDQLDELRNSILRDSSDLIAGNQDSLWADRTLIRYIADAERRFARQTMCLRDSTTPEVCRVTLREGKQFYPLHESVFSVLSARYWDQGTPYDLNRTGHALIAQASPIESVIFDPADPYTAQLPPGPPLAYFTDETSVALRTFRVTLGVYPTPSVTQDGTTLHLRVIRVPMTPYTANAAERESEIPLDYQLDVLEWAAYRAQRTFDGDAGAPTTSDAHKTAFEQAILDCKREMKRRFLATTTLGYSANGFTWTR